MRFFTDMGRGLLAASTALAALNANAQFAPYQPAQAQQAQAQQAQAGAYQGYPAARGYMPAPAQSYAQAPAQSYAPAPTQSFAPAQSYAPQAYAPAAGYPQTQPTYQPFGVPHMAMAMQNGAQPAENLPLTPPAEDVNAPAPTQNGSYPQPVPAADGYPNGAPGYAANGAGQGGYESYPSAASAAGYGCCNYSTYGGCDYPGKMHNLMCGCGCGCGYWFGGVYALYMDRDDSNKVALTFAAPTMPPGGYPPSSSTVVLTTRAVDTDYLPGGEVRFGRTFGCYTDPCTCCTSGPRWGVEGVYWQLFEDDETAQYVDQGTLRTYTMIPMNGLEYNPGTGYRPVNEYWDYAPPAQANDIEVRLNRVRSSFEVQNLELNLLRLGLCGGGCGTSCGGCCDTCNDCCSTGCSTGCGGGGCDGCGGCAPRRCCSTGFECVGVCGVRYMQFDEDFMYGVDFENTTTTATGFLNYWSTTENSLIGPQFGCNSTYCIGCRWGFHLNTLVGFYANDIDVNQYMVSPTGLVRFRGTGEDFDVSANKTDVAMLGELRMGASYRCSCHCRLFGGYRVLGVTGIALATDQRPNSFLDAGQMSHYVNSNGSMIVHGLQTGVEFCF